MKALFHRIPGKRACAIPAILLFDEIFLRLFAGDPVFSQFGYLLLFSAGLGLLLHGLLSFFRGGHNRRLTNGVLGFITALFTLEAIVHSALQKYISLPSLLNTAGSAGRNYGAQMRSAFFSNIPKMLLFAAPVLLFYFYNRKHEPAGSRTWKTPAVFALAGILLTLVTGIAVSGGSRRNVYGAQYDFDRATTTFGLATSSRLAVKYRIFGLPGSAFGTGTTDPSGGTGSADTAENTGTASSGASGEAAAAGSKNDGADSGTNGSGTDNGTTGSSASSGSNSSTSGGSAAEIRPQTIEGFDLTAFSNTGNAQADALTSYLLTQPLQTTNVYTGLFSGKNLILVCAESYSGYCLNEELMPTLWRLTHNGIYCSEYYQPEWGGSTTTGEASFLLGLAPRDGEQTMLATRSHNNYFTLGNQLQRLGYSSIAFHNGSYDYYHRNETHENLGYNQFIANETGLSALLGASYADDSVMMEKTADLYMDHEPFSIYYMTISGHAPYEADSSYVAEWYDRVNEVVGDTYAEKTKYYICYQMELEKAMSVLVEKLEAAGIADDTVIVMAGDHYPYGLGTGEVWNNDRNYINDLIKGDSTVTFEEDASDLVIWSGCLENELQGMAVQIDTPVMSLDLVPTLSNLFGLSYDSRLLPGRDIFSDAEPLVFWHEYSWVTTQGKYDARHDIYYPRDGYTDDPEYRGRIDALVQDKILMSRAIVDTDYYRILFGPDEVTFAGEMLFPGGLD